MGAAVAHILERPDSIRQRAQTAAAIASAVIAALVIAAITGLLREQTEAWNTLTIVLVVLATVAWVVSVVFFVLVVVFAQGKPTGQRYPEFLTDFQAYANTLRKRALVPGLILISSGDGTVFRTMFIAAGTGVDDAEQGVALGIASTSTSLGAAVGLALLVLVAAAGTDGLSGEALRIATADGISTAVLVIAAAIAATAIVALGLRPEARTHADTPCPRGLASAALRRGRS